MKIVIAPDSYKESLSAAEVARAIEAGFREVFPEARFQCLPVADGGEGTVDAMVAATGGRRVAQRVTGPLGQPVEAFYGLTGGGATAVIEMAAASGLALVPPLQRNPLLTTSFGTGELIRAALDAGARHLIIGIGGSATNDAGAGMLQALGVALLDGAGRALGPGGGGLDALAQLCIDGLDPRLAECRIEVACDVDNPLTGERGASAVFGPQKGATPAMVQRLDANLAHFAAVLQRVLGVVVAEVPGAGAAGGMGAALLGVVGARLRPGIDIVTAALGLEAAVAEADLVIVGEGRLDAQSLRGKAPLGVARIARRHGKPVIAIAGGLGDDLAALQAHGVDAAFSVVRRPCSLDEALAAAADNLRTAARNIAAALRIGGGLPACPGRAGGAAP